MAKLGICCQSLAATPMAMEYTGTPGFDPLIEGARRCTTTRWTLVLNAQEGSAEALEQLCRIYWAPVFSHILRKRPVDDAMDLAQDFFAELLAKGRMGAACSERGKFRTFLLTSVDNFLKNEYKARIAIKRGGQVSFISMELARESGCWPEEPSAVGDPSQDYDKNWARIIVKRVRDRLRNEFVESGKTVLFDTLEPYLTDRGEMLEEVAIKLGMQTNAVRVSLHRLRRRYGQLLREEVAHTVSDPAQVDEELRHLVAAYSP